MAGNALVVDGHPWWGARLYDPTTATFLSPDPLTPPTGALWANNPYDYANNNPLTLTDPLGTHPVTDDQLALLTHPIGTLAHYVANSVSTLVHHITDPISHWWAIHKDRILSPEFIGGALAIGLGIAVSATGVGGPIGAAIISGALFGAGSTTAIEKCATGHVNWRDVAMSGLVGGFTNGLGSWVSKTALLTKNAGQTVAGLRAMAGVNAFTGSIGSTISYTFSSGPKSLRGYAGALISGGAAGGLDGMAGPTAGSISRNLSKESSPFTEKVIEHTIGFGASTSGSVINSLVSGEHVSLADIGKTSVVNQAVSSAGSRLFPGQHGVESIESSSFGVRSLHGIIKPTGKNARRLWAGSAGRATLGIGANYLLDTFSETSQR
nr:RHS repeat-associated core domain-containing protein [Cutibacterium modestum]